jgi:SAM-dependent methyltransferase
MGMNYERIYRYRFRDVDQAARMAVWREIAQFVHDALGAPERVLDPAAGRGELINALPARERWAIDLVDYPEGTYDAGVRAIVSDVFEVELPQAHFDAVFVSNFLEHLPTRDAIATLLERLHATLRPGGRIGIIGPNFRHCVKQYFDMADHTLALTHRAIVEHVYAAGFEPERVEPRFLPYSFTYRLPPSPWLTRRYLRTPLAWRLLGRQFLVIGRR